MELEFDAPLWLSDGGSAGSWTFATVPPDLADVIRDVAAGARRGFGSVRVDASIGVTAWQTSLFPDRALGTYILPVKATVRRAEGVDEGDVVHVRLLVTDPVTGSARSSPHRGAPARPGRRPGT